MKNSHPRHSEKKLQQAKLLLCLLPVIGWTFSLWQLTRPQTNSQTKQVSRLSITLTLGWLIAYFALATGNSWDASQIWHIRLLYTNTLLTSGYLITSVLLMAIILQGRQPKLPGLNKLFLTLLAKKLS